MELDGKVAIVTGAGSGLGRAYADALAAAGARVVVADVDGDSAESAAAAIVASGATALHVRADVSNDDDVRSMVEFVTAKLDGVDILVNNAGLLRGRWNLCAELSSDEWGTIFAVNVIGALACARECRPSMKARGGGVIVNQSSMAAYGLLSSAYSVSKLALSAATVALAHELASDGIRVNGIAPGMMSGRIPDEMVQAVVDQQLIKRRGTTDDLIGVLLLLCSDRSSFMTGQIIHVDGGVDPRP